MKRLLTYFLILLVLFTCVTLPSANRDTHRDSQAHFARTNSSCEFVMVRDVSFEELLPQIRLRDTSASCTELRINSKEYSPKTLIHKSNAHFMTRRNCVCVPLRL